MWNQIIYMIKLTDLIQAYAELTIMCGSVNEVVINKIKDNPPRWYRYLRVQAMMRAFNLGPVEGFITGMFLDYKDNKKPFNLILEYIKKDIAKNKWDDLSENFKKNIYRLHLASEVPGLFGRLMEFRIKMEELTQFNSGTLTASGLYLYSVYKTSELGNKMNPVLRELDKLLVLLIDPEKSIKPVSEKRLISEFGYPNISIEDVDIEWI